MPRREQLHELHLALEGAVDQMTRAQRICTQAPLGLDSLDDQLDTAFAQVVQLRNRIREELMKALAAPPEPPTIRIKK
jgi:hypothetical protein